MRETGGFMKLFIIFAMLISSVSFAGQFTGFTKGNRCGQYIFGPGKRINICRGDKVYGTIMSPLAMQSDLRVTKVLENGVMVKNSSTEGFFAYGTFEKQGR
jgi:hypothetical protein